MVKTNSTMLPLGTPLPDFDLPVVNLLDERAGDLSNNDERISNSSLAPTPVLFMVICAHCPFVKHIEKELTKLDQEFGDLVQLIAIASNSLVTHPQDGPDQLAKQVKNNFWRFPYLLDLDQNFAKALKAACTPDFFLFAGNEDHQHKLLYRGQLDNSRPSNNLPVTGQHLRLALKAVLSGRIPDQEQKPSIGCNIKWHPGQEPDWFR